MTTTTPGRTRLINSTSMGGRPPGATLTAKPARLGVASWLTTRSQSENPVISAPEPKAHRPRSNRDWLPDQIDLAVLRPHDRTPNPVGGDFDW